MKTIYIHYGNDHFDEDMFKPIMNRPYSNKPLGGLWSSPEVSDITWAEWCEQNDFRELDKCFRFTIKDNAKVLVLQNKKDLDKLPRHNFNDFKNIMNEDIDFEALSKEYDAIMVYMYRGKDYFDNMYQCLYGWDCDTLFIMNKEIIEVI